MSELLAVILQRIQTQKNTERSWINIAEYVETTTQVQMEKKMLRL